MRGLEIQNALNTLIDKRKPLGNVTGKVRDVNTNDYTCTVDPNDGGAAFNNVRIRSLIDSSKKGFLFVPKEGSNVIIAPINNNDNSMYVVVYEEFSEVALVCENIKLNGDQFGGLIKIDELLNELNNFIQRFNNHTHNVPGIQAGSGTASAMPVTSPYNAIQKTQIENEKVKHG